MPTARSCTRRSRKASNHPEWEADIKKSFARRWVATGAKPGWYYQGDERRLEAEVVDRMMDAGPVPRRGSGPAFFCGTDPRRCGHNDCPPQWELVLSFLAGNGVLEA